MANLKKAKNTKFRYTHMYNRDGDNSLRKHHVQIGSYYTEMKLYT